MNKSRRTRAPIGYCTATQLAEWTGVSRQWIHTRMKAGYRFSTDLPKSKDCPFHRGTALIHRSLALVELRRRAKRLGRDLVTPAVKRQLGIR